MGQGPILGRRGGECPSPDPFPHLAPCGEPASAYVSVSVSLSPFPLHKVLSLSLSSLLSPLSSLKKCKISTIFKNLPHGIETTG